MKEIEEALYQERRQLESVIPTMVNMYEVQARDDAGIDTDALREAVSNELSLYYTRKGLKELFSCLKIKGSSTKPCQRPDRLVPITQDETLCAIVEDF
jgi:hypothetical protein